MPTKDVAVTQEQNLNRSGRKAGSKNKSTLVKEALRGKFDDLLVTEGEKVFKAVVARAIGEPLLDKDSQPVFDPETGEVVRVGGSDSAAKMIMDRMWPVQEEKGLGKIKLGEGGLVIHIEKLVAEPAPSDPIDGEAEEAQFTEVAQDVQVTE